MWAIGTNYYLEKEILFYLLFDFGVSICWFNFKCLFIFDSFLWTCHFQMWHRCLSLALVYFSYRQTSAGAQIKIKKTCFYLWFLSELFARLRPSIEHSMYKFENKIKKCNDRYNFNEQGKRDRVPRICRKIEWNNFKRNV